MSSLKLTEKEIFQEVINNIQSMLWNRGMKKDEIQKESTVDNSYLLIVPWKQRSVTMIILYINSTWVHISKIAVKLIENQVKKREKCETVIERDIQLLLVLKNKPTAANLQELNGLKHIETFLDKDFYMDKVKYYKCPKLFRILTPEEAEKVASKRMFTDANAKNKIKEIQSKMLQEGKSVDDINKAIKDIVPLETKYIFQQIDVNDALARYYNLRIGDMVQIITNITQQIDVSYQICCESQQQ
jgi:hypothetical protein